MKKIIDYNCFKKSLQFQINKELYVSLIILILSTFSYLYLYVYADRKKVFLYEHLGLKPFDNITIGRYWMCGLVISSIFSIIFFVLQFIITKFKKTDILCWSKIIIYSSIPLFVVIVVTISLIGEPKISFFIAFSSFIALVFGMCIGFYIATQLITNFQKTILHLLISVGFVPFLILFRVIELPQKGILSVDYSITIILFSIVFSFFWFMIINFLFKKHSFSYIDIIIGVLFFGYLCLPLIHYIFATPKGIPYITSSDNFFPDNFLLKLLNWLFLLILVYGFEKFSRLIYRK